MTQEGHDMKCTLINTSVCGHTSLWGASLKKLVRADGVKGDYPTEEECKAVQRRDGNLCAWPLTDGWMVYIDTLERSGAYEYPDQAYVALSMIGDENEASFRSAVDEMENVCMRGGGFLSQTLLARDRTDIEKHVKCVCKSLKESATRILKLTGNEEGN